MVQYRRNRVAGGTFFFTVVLADRRATHLTTHIAALRSAFRQTQSKRHFTIDAIVVLPEHLHAILTLPPEDADYSQRWRQIKAAFTDTLRKSGVPLSPCNDGTYQLWQRRFWEHTIRDDTDYASHVDYIHYNPGKHRHVTNPADWPYSSLHTHIRTQTLSPDWDPAPLQDLPVGEPT